MVRVVITGSTMMISLSGQWGLVLMGDQVVPYGIIILQEKDRGVITNYLLPAQRRRKCTAAACPTQRRSESSRWLKLPGKKKTETTFFSGHSYTIPTPKEFVFQGIGLAISNEVTVHM